MQTGFVFWESFSYDLWYPSVESESAASDFGPYYSAASEDTDWESFSYNLWYPSVESESAASELGPFYSAASEDTDSDCDYPVGEELLRKMIVHFLFQLS